LVVVVKGPKCFVTALLNAPSLVPVPNTENTPGEEYFERTIFFVKVPVGDLMVNVTGPAGRAGSSLVLICVGLTRNSGRLMLPALTVTPPSVCGGFEISGAVAELRARPGLYTAMIDSIEPGDRVLASMYDAPFTTRMF
jgi:hypothetical protein